MSDPIKKYLKLLLSRNESEISIAEAALWFAKTEYPDLQVQEYVERLDDWGEQVRARLSDLATVEEIIQTLNYFLFNELNFCPNKSDYYDPRNSYINEVMDRKLGIPLTLSIIYMEVGRRAGFPLEGVSFPGHYVVKFSLDNGEIVLDPYSLGISLDENDLEDLLLQAFGDSGDLRPPLDLLLESASATDTLLRLLRNLKSIYMRNDDLQKALSTVNLMLIVDPDLTDEVRERGQVYQKMNCFRAAIDAYQEYLEREPDVEDIEEVRANIIRMQRKHAGLH